MKNIDSELIEWAVEKIQKEYKDDVTLLIGQVGACKLPTDEMKMSFDYFVPVTERGYGLAETFIIDNMGYDLYPMSFERMEGIANFHEPRMVWVLEKSEIIYAGNEEDRIRFMDIKKKLHDNLANEEKTFPQALEFLNVAMEVYTTMLFEENLCKIRKAAGGVSSMLTYALGMINGKAVVNGYGNLIEEVNAMELRPEEFVAWYQQMLGAKEVESIREICGKLIQCTRTLLADKKKKWKQEPVKKEANYEDLAFWYQEARYTFRKIEYYAGVSDAALCYSLGCYLQIEFDAIRDEFLLSEMDLLSTFDADHLEHFQKRAEILETYLVDIIEENGVKLNSYESLEDFLQTHS